MNARPSFLRRPTTVTFEENEENKCQSKPRRLGTDIVYGRFSKVTGEVSGSGNEVLLKSLFIKLKDISLSRQFNYTLEKDIRLVLFRLHSSFIPRVKTWQDENGLDIAHICIISNHTDLLETLFIKKFIPISHQPMICPYAHLSAVLNRPECLNVVLTNRPDDHFKFVDSFSGRLPPYVLDVTAIADRDDRNMEMKTTCLLAKVFNYSRTIADDLNIPKEVIDHCAKLHKLHSKQHKGFKKGSLARSSTHRSLYSPSAGSTPSIFKLDKEGLLGQTRLSSTESSKADLVKLSLTPKETESFANYENDESDDDDDEDEDDEDDESSVWEREQSQTGEPLHKSTYKIVAAKRVANTNLQALREIDPHQHSSHVSELPIDRRSTRERLNSYATKERRSVEKALREERNAKRAAAKEERIRAAKKAAERGVGWRGTFAKVKAVASLRNRNQNASAVNNSVATSRIDNLENETPLSIAYKNGFFRCVKVILDIIVAKQFGGNKESPLLTATTAEDPAAIMVLCEGGADVQFDDFQDAVLLALRLNRAECCNVLLSSHRNQGFRERLLGGDNLLHVMYTRSMAEASRGITRCLNEMTCMLINNKESVVVSKPGQYPLYSLIVCAFNDESTTDPSQYFESFKTLLEAGSNHIYKEKRSTEKLNVVGRRIFTSVFDCVFRSAQTSIFALDKPGLVQDLLRRFCIDLYDHNTDRRPFGNKNSCSLMFSYMALAVEFAIDIDVLKVLLRLGFNPIYKYQGYYAVNYYFHILFSYLEKYEVENFAEFYKAEVEKLMYLCHRMPLAWLKDAMLIFLDNQMAGISAQAIFVARYFCHLVGQIVTSPRSLRDTCALQLWYKKYNRHERVVDKLPIPTSLKRRIIP